MRFEGYCLFKRARETDDGEIEVTLVLPKVKNEKERHELLSLSSCYQDHPEIQYKKPMEGFVKLQVIPKGQKKLGESI